MKKIGLVIATITTLLLISLLPMITASAATTYTDITPTFRAYKEINYLSTGNMISTDDPNLFEPDKPMTRAHAAVMIGKALQLKGEQGTASFPDVPENNFASGYISEMVDRGIIFGTTEGNFEPDRQLKRGEMAHLLGRAFFSYTGNTTTNEVAADFLAKGISIGTLEGHFGTNDLMKRSDFAVFLARSINADFRVGGQALESTTRYVDIGETDVLNFRTGPSTNYAVSMQLFAGYPVEVYYSVGEWQFAKVAGAYGFISEQFLSSTQPVVSAIKDPINVGSPVKPPVSGKKPLNQLVVILDPGHGGTDPGATANGLREKDVVLDISKRMKKYYMSTPIQVKLTRETDVYPSLQDRVNFAKRNNGDLFISVHANAFNGKATGIETFYYGAATNPNVKESRALATYTQKRMLEAWKLPDRRVQSKSLHVIRENSMPATLVEIGFIDNPKDVTYIKSDSQREVMAKAIFLGTLDYLYHYEGRTEVAELYKKFNASPSRKY